MGGCVRPGAEEEAGEAVTEGTAKGDRDLTADGDEEVEHSSWKKVEFFFLFIQPIRGLLCVRH